MIAQHENLKIWQKSYDLAKDLIQMSERFPRPQQLNGLASEIRQTAMDMIRTVMLANSVQGTAVNQDLDQEISYLQVIVRLARDLTRGLPRAQLPDRWPTSIPPGHIRPGRGD